jgi:hypothetical protein
MTGGGGSGRERGRRLPKAVENRARPEPEVGIEAVGAQSLLGSATVVLSELVGERGGSPASALVVGDGDVGVGGSAMVLAEVEGTRLHVE